MVYNHDSENACALNTRLSRSRISGNPRITFPNFITTTQTSHVPSTTLSLCLSRSRARALSFALSRALSFSRAHSLSRALSRAMSPERLLSSVPFGASRGLLLATTLALTWAFLTYLISHLAGHLTGFRPSKSMIPIKVLRPQKLRKRNHFLCAFWVSVCLGLVFTPTLCLYGFRF